MSTSLHAIFNINSGNVYFVIVFPKIHGRKMRFPESGQNSISEKSGWLIPVCTIKEKYFNEKMSSLAGLKKVIQFSAKVPILAIFDYLGPHSKSIFSTYRQNSKKSLVSFLGEVVRNIVLTFQLSIFKNLRGGASHFASRHFPKSVILASCNFVERPFVVCCACSIVIFHSS